MKIIPVLLGLEVGAYDFNDWEPEDSHCFFVQVAIPLRFSVDDINMFYLDISSIKWLEKSLEEQFIEKMLLLKLYNRNNILNFINKILFEVEYNDIEDYYLHLRKYFKWEFDDYTLGK